MLVFKENAGFQEPVLNFSPTTNLEMRLLPSAIRDSLVQKAYHMLNSGLQDTYILAPGTGNLTLHGRRDFAVRLSEES